MSYLDAYHAWLNSPALSAAEKAELASIQGDDKEIESRFFDQLSFGTAGLRGTMGVGLYRMNVHVIRHATQAFAEVILAEGPEAVKRGIKAGDLVKSVCAICGGKGGGKPDSAMGGGSDLLKLDDALATVDDFVAEKLK